MTQSDPPILELYEETTIAMPPAVVAYNIDGVSYPTVKRRIPILAENGLLERVKDKQGYYQITAHGQAYLAGELEREDLENE